MYLNLKKKKKVLIDILLRILGQYWPGFAVLEFEIFYCLIFLCLFHLY